MKFEEIIKEFSIVVYGELEKYSETLSKGRCRIFYKGVNRNGTYITDEFAEKLIQTLPYAPVKGIYEDLMEDYSDHGEERDEGRIYGIVPQDMNFAWEAHEDEDGELRIYACTDVLLYTAIYKEAKEIIGKPQSMELFPPSIKGDWEEIEGKKVFVYSEACFLGLQVLGEETEPCFEGAAFFNLYNALSELINASNYTKTEEIPNNEGGKGMDKLNFKLSDNQKYEKLWGILNPNCNEENNWVCDYSITDIYEDYALCYNHEEQAYERVYYAKDEENDVVTISAKKKCYIVDVTEDEMTALKTVQALNGGNYEKLDETFGKIETLEKDAEEFGLKIAEQEGQINTLTTEKDELTGEFSALVEEKKGLEGQVEALEAYKLDIETKEKEVVIEKYSKLISSEAIEVYANKINEYTKDNLEKDLAFELVNSNPSVFSLDTNKGYIPKENPTKGGLEEILDRYANK